MPSTPHPDDVALATALVRDAVDLAARMRADGLDVDRKTSVSDLVTSADHAAEELVVGRLRAERPDDGLLAEEGSHHDGTSGRRWVIDPVDGTYNFAHGSDHWCSAIALVEDDDVVLGAVAHHATGRVLVGGPDLPTTCDGEPVERLADRPVAELGAATYLHPSAIDVAQVREPFLRAARLPATLRMLGSGSMDLVGVTTGMVGCWFQHSTPPWDWWPGSALVRGAGGEARRLDVEGLTWSVAGPPGAATALAAALAGAPHD